MTKVLAALAGLRVSVMMVKGGSGSTESNHRCAEGPQPSPTFLCFCMFWGQIGSSLKNCALGEYRLEKSGKLEKQDELEFSVNIC